MNLDSRLAVPFVTPKRPNGTLLLYLNKELKSIGISPEDVIRYREGERTEEIKKNSVVQVFLLDDIKKIIIAPYGEPVWNIFRPPGIQKKLWLSFLAYVVNKWGVTKISEGIVEEFRELMKDRVVEVSKVFGIKIGEKWIYDETKLPKDLVDYIKDL